MANVKRFRLMDEQGNVIVYDIGAGSITFDDRNMTLPQVVAMLEAAIEVAGQVKSVTMNGTKNEPDEETGDINLGNVVTDVSDKANKDELTVTNGASADKKVIQLKNGTSVEVIISHQDISGKVDKADIANALDVTAYGKVLDARQGKALNDLIAALQSGKSDKSATVSGLSYDTTSHKLKQTVNGTASDVMTVDTAPTANSDNPVTSGGVSTALATLLANISIGNDGYWYIGQTSTGVKAQGPKGNSVVDGDTFDIVNNLTDGGEGDALSAEMGKTLKAMIDRISAFTGYAVAASVSELPATGDATTGYIVGTHIYAYVETGGDTAGGKYQDLGDVAGAGTYVTTNGDGTFTIHVGSDTYSINLNHTHENMAKLIVCKESDLPSTLALDTIYAQVDNASAPTEIVKLFIAGVEFKNYILPDTGEQIIITPSDGATLDLGANDGSGVSKTITIRGKHLTGDLSVAVSTGITLSYGQLTGQSSITIPKADALVGVQVIVSYGGSGALADGSLVISSGNDVLSEVDVVVTQYMTSLTAVKFTKQQFVETDIKPGPTTRLEIDMKLDGAITTPDLVSTDYNFIGGGTSNGKTFLVSGSSESTASSQVFIFSVESSSVTKRFTVTGAAITTRSTMIIDMANKQASFGGQSVNLDTKTTTMTNKMKFGSNSSGVKPYGQYDLIVYGIKHYENNVLTHDYTPVKRDGVVGLYDSVTDTFISSGTNVSLVEVNS